MALFESYDRREPQILAVLKNYGIGSIEECAEICKAKGLDIYKLVEGIQPICFENAKWAYTVGCAIAIKKGCKRAGKRRPLPAAGRRNPAIFPCYLHDLRQVRAGNGEQLLVHFSAALIAAKNQPLSILFVLQQQNTAARAGFHHAYSFIIRCHAMQQILINGGFPLFHYAPGILISSAQNSIIIRSTVTIVKAAFP